MSGSRIDAPRLREVYQASFEKKAQEDEKKKQRHQDFLVRLKDSSDRFQKELSEEIDKNLLSAASKGRTSTRWESRFGFSGHFGNVRVSTLVYGWRTPQCWDKTRFSEIGLDGTPFDTLVKSYQGIGITLRDVSNPNRGFGFWLEASFEAA